jgi:hypothetical protein
MRTTMRLGAFALAACTSGPAVAQGPDATRELALSAYSGGEADDDSGRRIDLGLSVVTPGGTSYSLDGSRGEVDNNVESFVSSSATFTLAHNFQRFGLNGGVRQLREQDLARSITVLGGAYVKFDPAQFGVTLERRQINFDDTQFTLTGSEVGIPIISSITSTASCDLNSTGYGINARFDQPRWGVYGSGMVFDYSGYQCSFALSGALAGQALATFAVRQPAQFQRIAATATDAFEGLGGSLLPREAALLQSTVMLGTQIYTSGRTSLGAEVYRDADQFAASSSNTFLAFFDWVATPNIAITATLGTSDRDTAGRLRFAGLRLTVSL